ncbi:MAG: hypothetical protein U0R28_05490 [Candidatus Nanopelagicales bacterium]
MRRTKTTAVAALALAIVATAPAVARPGQPAGGSDRIVTTGVCDAGSTWTLSGRSRFLRVVVSARIDTTPRQRWVLRVQHNQVTVASLSRKSSGRGVVKVKGRVRNEPGMDTFTFTARNRNTNEICQGTLTF